MHLKHTYKAHNSQCASFNCTGIWLHIEEKGLVFITLLSKINALLNFFILDFLLIVDETIKMLSKALLKVKSSESERERDREHTSERERSLDFTICIISH